jgi:valyl-tRNA synthetase
MWKQREKKLEQELEYSKGFLNSVQRKLGNDRFVNSAPEKVVENEKKKQSDTLLKISLLEEKLSNLN